MVGHTGDPLDLILEEAVILAPPEIDILVVSLHIRTVDEVLREGSHDGVGGGEAGGLDDADIRAGKEDFLRVGVAHIVVVVVENHQVIEQGAEDGGIDEDCATALQGLFRHREVHGLHGIVGGSDTSQGDGDDTGIGGHLGEEAVNEVGTGGVTLPDEGLDALVNLLDEGVDDVLLERQFVLRGVHADEVLRILAEQGLRANLAVDLDGRSGDVLLREGDFVKGVEATFGTVLEDSGEGEVVEGGNLLDTGLETDFATGSGTRKAEGLDDEVAVRCHIVGQGTDEEVGNSRHSIEIF